MNEYKNKPISLKGAAVVKVIMSFFRDDLSQIHEDLHYF